ncbi:MAG: hypothetical protein QOH95_2109, partial [Gaiellaceae bacterium]|nr:hypothetical protein [Gaiellaceae bacterium]
MDVDGVPRMARGAGWSGLRSRPGDAGV